MIEATKRNILVCEDDPVQLAVLSAALGQAGYETLTARSPEEALERVRHKRADAVVADVQLMGGDAFDVLKDLRKRGLDAPVLVVSGHANPRLKARAFEEGAKDFLEKPLDLASVVQGVRRIVDPPVTRAPAKPRVLLLEGTEKGRHEAAEAFVEAGLLVTTAVDGLDALEKVKSTKPAFDMAVVDLHCAALGGAPLVQKLMDADPGLHLVMLAGASDREAVIAGYKAGADNLVWKPCDATRMADLVKQSLPVARRKRERESQQAKGTASTITRRIEKVLQLEKEPARRHAIKVQAAVMAGALLVGILGAVMLQWTLRAQESYEDKLEKALQKIEERVDTRVDTRLRTERAAGEAPGF